MKDINLLRDDDGGGGTGKHENDPKNCRSESEHGDSEGGRERLQDLKNEEG